MIITKFETWWVERGRCLFDEKRQGGAKMGWDVRSEERRVGKEC